MENDSIPVIKVINVPNIPHHQWNTVRQRQRRWNVQQTTKHQTIFHCKNLSLQSMLRDLSWNTRKKWSQEEREVVKESCILVEKRTTVWYDGDGNKLMQYLPEFLSEELSQSMESELHRLIKVSPPTLPSGTRYKRCHEWRKSLPFDMPCGLYSYAIYPNQGHPNDCPHPSADSAGKSVRSTNAACILRLSPAMIELSTQLSLAFAAIDKPAWDMSRGMVMAAKEEYGVLAAMDRCETQCFVGIFVLVNVFTDEHFDDNDVPDGWAVMAVFGKFRGAPLYLPQLEIKVSHQRRDVIFLRSRVLQHLSEEFEILENDGRYVLVFTNDARTFKYLSKHYRLVFCSSK